MTNKLTPATKKAIAASPGFRGIRKNGYVEYVDGSGISGVMDWSDYLTLVIDKGNETGGGV